MDYIHKSKHNQLINNASIPAEFIIFEVRPTAMVMKDRKLIILLLLLLTGSIVSGQQLLLDLGNSHQPVGMVCFSPDGKYLMAGGMMKIWDAADGSMLYTSADRAGEFAADIVLSADISDDGRYLAMVKTGRLQVIDLSSRTVTAVVRNLKMSGAAFGPDSQTVAYLLSDGTVGMINASNGDKISERKISAVKPLRIAWAPSGRYIALGGRGNTLVLFDTEQKKVTASAGTGGKWVMDMDFSVDSRYLAVAQKGGVIRLIEAATGNEVKFWNAHQGDVHSVSFHPSGRYLASGGGDNFVRIWDIPGGSPVSSWQAHDRTVMSVDFSSDGTMLASGCLNTVLAGVSDTRIWDTGTLLGSVASSGRTDTGNPPANIQSNPVTTKPVEQQLPAATAADQKRLALVIGNGIYQHGGILANPENDASDIAAKLTQLGFTVMLYQNLDQKGFKKAIDDFGAKLAGYDIGLFYYAGHGIQVKGSNYLIPVDANLSSENDVEYDCVDAGRLLAKMEDAGSTTNIIILDACRDNPFERSWRRSTHGQGLAFMTAPAGSLISYATSPGATASDGSGRNGLFTSALLNYIDEPGLSVLEVFQKVRTFVRENSNGDQVPWESTSLEGNFYFK